jgi:hypothetical protein
MADYPLKLRCRQYDGTVVTYARASSHEDARGIIEQWRRKGFNRFQIEDAKGQSLKESDLA